MGPEEGRADVAWEPASDGDSTHRLRVAGGWLYRETTWSEESGDAIAVSVVHVPDIFDWRDAIEAAVDVVQECREEGETDHRTIKARIEALLELDRDA